MFLFWFGVFSVLPRQQLEKNPPRSPLQYILASVKTSLEQHLGQKADIDIS